MTISTSLDMRILEKIERELHDKAEAIVNKTAFEAQGRAQNNAPVDTGALRNSIYTVTKDSSGFKAAVIAVESMNQNVRTAEIPVPDEDLTAHVGPSVEYAIYQELGTVKMPAQPFLIPAVESLRGAWEAAWRAFFRSMA